MKLFKQFIGQFTALLLVVLALSFVFGSVVYASTWEYKFPITCTDNTSTDRTYYPVMLGFGASSLIDAEYLDNTCLDSDIQIGSSIKYMMSTTNVTAVISNLYADGKQTLNLYTGYTPAQTGFPIITGDGGYFTVSDNDAMELSNYFQLLYDGYVDVARVGDKDIIEKNEAVLVQAESSTDDAVEAEFVDCAYPVIIGSNSGNNTSDTLTHTVNLPTNRPAQSFLLVLFTADTNPTITFPGGWTKLFDGILADVSLVGYYRVALGTESNSITVTTSANETSSYISYSMLNVDSTTASEYSITNGVDANPDSPNLAPSWTEVRTKWLSVCGYRDNDSVATYPASYNEGINSYANVADGCGIGSAWRNTAGASENPGTFTISAVDTWVAVTIGIRGSLRVISDTMSNGDYTVNVTGHANYPQLATGYVLHFTGDANSYLNCGVIYSAATKLWVSFWFKLDTAFGAGSPNNIELITKRVGAADYYRVVLDNGDGKLYFVNRTGGVSHFTLTSTQTSWSSNTWYHVIASISSVNGARLRINNGTAVTDADTSAIVNGGNLYLGYYTAATTNGLIGEMMNVVVGTDDLTVGEENNLYAGTTPGDKTDYWYMDNGGETIVTSYGSSANTGTAGSSNSWATIGSIGRWCDVTLQIGSDIWGSNLKGASVNANNNDWEFGGSATSYIDSYKHYVGGVLIAWYQPNTRLIGTAVVDRQGGDNGGVITWGSNNGVEILYGEMESYESTTATSNETGGFELPSSPMPATWFAGGENMANLPFYDSFLSASLQTGQPLQTIYFLAIIGLAFGVCLLLIVTTKSALLGVVSFNIVLFIGSSMTIVPMWIPFVCLVVQMGILYLYRQVAY